MGGKPLVSTYSYHNCDKHKLKLRGVLFDVSRYIKGKINGREREGFEFDRFGQRVKLFKCFYILNSVKSLLPGRAAYTWSFIVSYVTLFDETGKQVL